jgi:hypothetical protein
MPSGENRNANTTESTAMVFVPLFGPAGVPPPRGGGARGENLSVAGGGP